MKVKRNEVYNWKEGAIHIYLQAFSSLFLFFKEGSLELLQTCISSVDKTVQFRLHNIEHILRIYNYTYGGVMYFSIVFCLIFFWMVSYFASVLRMAKQTPLVMAMSDFLTHIL